MAIAPSLSGKYAVAHGQSLPEDGHFAKVW